MIRSDFVVRASRLAGRFAVFFFAGVSFFGTLRAQDSVIPPSFGIVVIPDSQYLVASFTNRWNDQIAWISNNAARCNIKAVMHLGDLVDNCTGDTNNSSQWRAAMYGLGNLRAAGVPLILAPGNHDTWGMAPLNLTNITQAGLCPNWFSNYSNYGQGWSMGFQNPTNLSGSYLLITNGTQPYLITCLAWQPNQTMLTWASNIVQTYSAVPAIYFEHIFVGQRQDGRISSWSDPWSIDRAGAAWDPRYFTPTYLWTNWLRTTTNIFWVASGHEPNDANAAYYGLAAADGHTMTFTLTDFQNFALSSPSGYQGSNYMQLVTINPDQNTATVFTFSPTFATHPLLYSNTAFSFPLSGSVGVRLSGWQLAQQQSAALGGLAAYVNFDITNSSTELGPYSAKMVRSNLVYAATELGMSAFFSNTDNNLTGAYVGCPLSCGGGVDMELDQFSGLSQVTLSCWFKTSNRFWGAGSHALVGKFNTSLDGDFQLCVTPQSLLRFSVVNAGKTRVDLDVNAPAFNDGGWHHFCGVYDGTNMYSYFDSVLLGAAPQTGPIRTTAHAVAIGNNDTQNGYSWRGYLDEVKLLTVAWTPDLVSQEYQRLATNLPLAGNLPTGITLGPAPGLPPTLTNAPSVIGFMASLPSSPVTNSLSLFGTSALGNAVLIYPAWASNFVIECSASMAPDSWSQLNGTVNTVSNYLVVGLSGTYSNMFFRLRQ